MRTAAHPLLLQTSKLILGKQQVTSHLDLTEHSFLPIMPFFFFLGTLFPSLLAHISFYLIHIYRREHPLFIVC